MVHQKWFQPIMGEIATTWQLIGIILLFCILFGWLRLPKEIFLKCWRCKICKDRMCVTTIPKAIIICTTQKVFNINLWQKIISINAQIKKRQNQGFWNLLKANQSPRMKFESFQTTFIKTLEQDKSHFFYNGNLEMVKNIHFKMWIYLLFNI